MFENPLVFLSNKFRLSLKELHRQVNFSEKDVANWKAITMTLASPSLCFIQHFIFTIGFEDCRVHYHNHFHSISS